MPKDDVTPTPAGAPGAPRRRAPLHRGLPLRLLLLTVLFVMLAEVLIFVPSVARYRVEYLKEHMEQAHLALLALEATPDGMVDEYLQKRLLDHAGALGMTAWRPERTTLMLGIEPEELDARFDLRSAGFFELLADGLAVMARTDDRMIGVMGVSPKDADVRIDVVLREAPMRHEMFAYGERIFYLSLMISLFTAGLVYLSLHLLLVRPLLRMADNMADFRAAPEDPDRTLRPSRRHDEVGMVERSLAEMQTDLRRALVQQARLAAVGTAVSKISHDLKGVLSAALLESDRLEASAADPEVKHVTSGIARALDRAVELCTRTLRFAKEGPPEVRPGRVDLPALIEDSATTAPGVAVSVAMPEGLAVRADPGQLSRVFDNLLRNAVEAGAKTVTVSAWARGDRAEVEVADDGSGLPAKARENLFQPFSGSARAGGTGLGLPLSREILRALRGDLTLARTGADGTVFRLVLPLAGHEPG
ncbi:Sensor histidine kinase [Caenispirillum salinarum AK4]|uniref:histidine kinase n=1 Tax=Caenispirillum salinarum AK4 TaxID=1238182 RepID=K9GVF3_9PROT|nr:HAMP domain-containing sensor histidine kinase [Caenispirillum salinarum]EKV29157.1 Sensor histidine kinase [Caenispirillum salinarum AK4]